MPHSTLKLHINDIENSTTNHFNHADPKINESQIRWEFFQGNHLQWTQNKDYETILKDCGFSAKSYTHSVQQQKKTNRKI